jgi:hypothetical protein
MCEARYKREEERAIVAMALEFFTVCSILVFGICRGYRESGAALFRTEMDVTT